MSDKPEIKQINFFDGGGGSVAQYVTGANCSKIETFSSPGEYCSIPHIRVLGYDGSLIAEFNRNSLAGVFFV